MSRKLKILICVFSSIQIDSIFVFKGLISSGVIRMPTLLLQVQLWQQFERGTRSQRRGLTLLSSISRGQAGTQLLWLRNFTCTWAKCVVCSSQALNGIACKLEAVSVSWRVYVGHSNGLEDTSQSWARTTSFFGMCIVWPTHTCWVTLNCTV